MDRKYRFSSTDRRQGERRRAETVEIEMKLSESDEWEGRGGGVRRGDRKRRRVIS